MCMCIYSTLVDSQHAVGEDLIEESSKLVIHRVYNNIYPIHYGDIPVQNPNPYTRALASMYLNSYYPNPYTHLTCKHTYVHVHAYTYK